MIQRSIWTLVLLFSNLGVGTPRLVFAEPYADPDPPKQIRPDTGLATRLYAPLVVTTEPTQEWTWHKTSDSLHPDGQEQTQLWLLNRARKNPAAEGIWLAGSNESEVANGRDFFNVDLEMLRQEFAALAPKPPAAFDARLYQAAKAHSLDLIARDAQDHEGQFDKVEASGFQWGALRGNVFAYASNGLNAHAAYNIDWGSGPGNMQTNRGHRQALMSIDGAYTNVGIASIAENDPGTAVGPWVTTGNFALAQANGIDHFNRFIVGTVWDDLDGDGKYDPGEGIGGVLVKPDWGTYYAVTSAGGGYSIPIPTPGSYQVRFSGGGIGPEVVKTVSVGNDSVLLDHLLGTPSHNLDIDGDGVATAKIDGVLLARYGLGLHDTAITEGIVLPPYSHRTPSEIESYLDTSGESFDIDGNGTVDPLTDAVMVLRHLSGHTGSVVTNGAIGSNPSRTPAEMLAYLGELFP